MLPAGELEMMMQNQRDARSLTLYWQRSGIVYHPELYRLCEVPNCVVRVKLPRTVCTENTWDARHMAYALGQA